MSGNSVKMKEIVKRHYDNSDPIATNPIFGGGIDSFYNSDIDNTVVNNYFTGYFAGLESHPFGTLGIDDLAFENANISVYPNPTKGSLNIKTDKTISYAIYNILGQSVKLSGNINNNSERFINISHLPDGIYILKAEDDNKNSKSFKIIKRE